MRAIVARSLPGAKASIGFDEDGYPPMAVKPGSVALLAKMNAVNADLGLPAMEALDPLKRGAADISFVAPDVDGGINGLGPASRGDHSPDEAVDIAIDLAPGQARGDLDEPAGASRDAGYEQLRRGKLCPYRHLCCVARLGINRAQRPRLHQRSRGGFSMTNHRLFAGALLAATALSVATPAAAQRIDRIVVFGDSYADDNNATSLILANPGTPAATRAQIQQLYPTGRFSGGTNYIDTLSQLLNAPVENFAIGGARTGNRNQTPGLPGFTFEVNTFLAGGAPAPFQTVTPSFGEGDLVAVSIGGNDARAFAGTLAARPPRQQASPPPAPRPTSTAWSPPARRTSASSPAIPRGCPKSRPTPPRRRCATPFRPTSTPRSRARSPAMPPMA